MSKFWHGFLHAAAIGVQYSVLATQFVPTGFKPLAAGIVALLQGILAVSQHGN